MHRSVEKEALKKAKKDSIESEQDRQVRVQEMLAGAVSSKLKSDNVERGSDVALISDIPLSLPAITDATIAEIVPPFVRTNIKDGGLKLRHM